MIALNPAPLVARPVKNTCHPERSAARRAVEGQPQASDLEAALKKVKTPEDDALAQQQQAFDQMMQQRTEMAREANAIREFGIAQQKKENDFLNEYIRMI